MAPPENNENEQTNDHPMISPTESPAPFLNPLPEPKRFPRSWLQTLLQQHSSTQQSTTLPPSPSQSPHQQHYLQENNTNDSILHNKALVVAPMVDQSDLPFRLLCRKYGANLCFTPMIHAKMFLDKQLHYRHKFWKYHGMPPEDRPLVAQFCSSDPDALLEAAGKIQHQVDAIDLNCGCPQTIAKRGKYGAFLLENEDQLLKVVRTLSSQLDIPITVKVRILPSGIQDSLKLYQKLVEAGASMITVHGRNRFQKGQETGKADWNAIQQVVQTIGNEIPILANGSISNLEDVVNCLKQTDADGVMSSEAVLEYPAMFLGQKLHERKIGRIQLAYEYLKYCEEYPPDKGGQGSGLKCVRVHLHRMLHADLQTNTELRNKLVFAKSYDEIRDIVNTINEIQKSNGHLVNEEEASWYIRHRIIDNEFNVPKSRLAWEKTKIVKCVELDDETAAGIMDMFGDNEDCWGDCAK